MKPVRVGLIGCGEIAAKDTLPAIQASGRLKVVAAMDVNLDLARDLAEKGGAAFWTDRAETLAARPDVEAVIVSTPHHLHVPMGLLAARHGKHVLVEKPIATTGADARRLIAACKRKGVILSVLYIRRFEPVARKTAELIRKGVLGRTTGFSLISMGEKKESYWTSGFTGRVVTDWRTRKATSGGGFLMMNFSHNIDLIQSLLGVEPASVYAQYDTFRTPVEVEDYVSVTARYRCGAIGTFLGSTVCPGALRVPDHIFGTHGTIVMDNPLRVFTRKKIRGLKPDEWNEFPLPSARASRADFLTQFAKAVRGQAAPPATGEEALVSLRVIEAAYRSQEERKPIALARGARRS